MTTKLPPNPHRHRRPPSRLANASNTVPAWQRWLAAVLLIGGGGLAAAWGIHDTLAWLAALHRGDAVIETESMILGLPFLGGGLCAIGPTFLIPKAVVPSDRLTARLVVPMLGAIAVGILLIPLGALVIDATMASEGYRSCSVYGRGRYTAVTWAGVETTCPAAGSEGSQDGASP